MIKFVYPEAQSGNLYIEFFVRYHCFNLNLRANLYIIFSTYALLKGKERLIYCSVFVLPMELFFVEVFDDKRNTDCEAEFSVDEVSIVI